MSEASKCNLLPQCSCDAVSNSQLSLCSPHAPFSNKQNVEMSLADFRLYDRSLSADEVVALFTDAGSECCISAGLKDAFGVADLDLTNEAMSGQPQEAVVAITSSEQASVAHRGTNSPGCVADEASVRQLEICLINTVSDCNGVISDGVGPYADSLNCGLRLEGFIGSTYAVFR